MLPAVAPPVLAAAESDGHRQVLLETPAMGFAWVEVGEVPANVAKPKTEARAADELLVAEQHELRNEFFQARVSPTTGAIQSIQNYSIRGNRLAQQIAMRLPPSPEVGRDVGPEAEENYSVMAADEISASRLGPMEGMVVSRGRLVDREGKRVARFVQTMIARRGNPVLELEIELDLDRLPDSNPWRSYYAVRFAWSDETADLFQGVGWCPQPSEGNHIEAPHFLDIRSPKTRLTVLSAGLPYHRRYGLRKLDTLLVVHGETARKFRLGIGVDVRYPAPTAIDCIARPPELYRQAGAPGAPWGWLFHLDARNVLATRWDVLHNQGRPTGFRARLLETEGRHCELTLRSFRRLASARKVDFVGSLQSELPVDGDQVAVELFPRQWVQVEAMLWDRD
jgi:alpha-mannosidase